MSAILMNCAYAHSGATGAAQTVLMALAYRAYDGKAGSVKTSVEALMQWANCDRTTVQRAFKALTSLGLLDVIPNRQSGRGHMNTYLPGCAICHALAVKKGGTSAALFEAQRAASALGKGGIYSDKGRRGRSPVSEGRNEGAAVGVEGADAAPTHEGATVLRDRDFRTLGDRIAATGTVGDESFMAHVVQRGRREG